MTINGINKANFKLIFLLSIFLMSIGQIVFCQNNSILSGYYDIEFGTSKKDVAKELTKRTIKIDTNYSNKNVFDYYNSFYPNSYIHITDRIEFILEDFIIDVYFLFDRYNSDKFFEANVEIEKFYKTIPDGEKGFQEILDILVSKYGNYDSTVNRIDVPKNGLLEFGREYEYYWHFLNGSIVFRADFNDFYSKVDFFKEKDLKVEGGDLRIYIKYEDSFLTDKYFENERKEDKKRNDKEDEIRKSKF